MPRARLAGQARGPNGRLAAKKGPLVSANGELSPLSRTQRAIGQKRTPPKAAGLSYALWAETRQAHFSTRSVSPRRFNRGPPQAYPSPHALAAKGSERSQRRISPRGHRPESETTRPLKTDEQASGSVGRITPGMAVQELPKESLQPFPQHRELPHHRQYLTAFSTVSAESRHRSNVSMRKKPTFPGRAGSNSPRASLIVVFVFLSPRLSSSPGSRLRPCNCAERQEQKSYPGSSAVQFEPQHSLPREANPGRSSR
jgi:hypothetical protein